MGRPLCFRQGKNLSKNLREALRSLPWGTHHIADVADLKFCLLSRSFFGQCKGVFLPRRWSWGCVSAVDSCGHTIWIADAHRDNGKRFVVRANDKLTAVLQLQEAVRKNTIDIVCRRLAELRPR